MSPAKKTYNKEMALSMVIYLITIFAVNSFLNANALPMWQTVPLSILPAIPVLFAARAAVVYSRTWDALQRKTTMEATLVAFLFVGLGTFSYGFLEGVGFPVLETTMFFPLLIITQGLTRIYIGRQYS